MQTPRFPKIADALITRVECLMDLTIPALERDWTEAREAAARKQAEVGAARALLQEHFEILEHLGHAQRSESGDWAITRPAQD